MMILDPIVFSVDGLNRATVLPDFTMSIVNPCCILAKKLDQFRTTSVAVAFMNSKYAFYILDASSVSFALRRTTRSIERPIPGLWRRFPIEEVPGAPCRTSRNELVLWADNGRQSQGGFRPPSRRPVDLALRRAGFSGGSIVLDQGLAVHGSPGRLAGGW